MQRSIVLPVLLALASPAASQCDIQTFTPSGITGGDQFGASISVRGDIALVGAPENGPSGTVRVLVRQGDVWSQDQALVPTATDGARFGHAVALFGDLALVGAPEQASKGAVHVYERIAGVWSQTAELVASDADANDRFGFAVALEGSRAVIGAPGVDPFGTTVAYGAAYVFEHSAGVWTETAKLVASDAGAGDAFGDSVALEGTLALIGASGNGAYFFSKEAAGWTETQHFATGARDVSLSAPYAIVGVGGTGIGGGGNAYVYRLEPGGWTLDDVLHPAGSVSFGASVALTSGVGAPVALVGDPEKGFYGSTYLFRRNVGWTQMAEYVPPGTPAAGADVSIGGGSAMVGAPQHPYLAPMKTGAVHAFTLTPLDISQVQGIPSFFFDSLGGFQAMFFDTCVGFAGNRYIVLGSASGTSPGTTIGGAFIPLNPDGYFGQTLTGSAVPLFLESGAIRSDGLAQAYFFLEPGFLPASLIGTTVHHAFAVLDPFTGEYLFASDPIPLDLLP